MKYKEFKKAVEDWGRKYHYKPVIDVASTYIEIAFEDEYYMDRICTIHKSKRFVVDLNSNLFKSFFDDARNDLFKIVSEFATTKPEEREDEKEIQTNAEDVMNWTIEEIQERSWNLRNNLEDIIIDLEKVKEANKREWPGDK